MKRIGKYLVLSISFLLISFVYTSCDDEVKDQMVVENQDVSVYLLMEFEHTGCFGTCPIYDIQVYSNGKVYYTGTLYTDYLGEIDGFLNRGELSKVNDALETFSLLPVDVNHNDQGIDLPKTRFRYYQEGSQVYEELSCMGTCENRYNKDLLIVEELLLKAVLWN